MAAGRRSRRSPAALVLEGHLPEPAIAAAVIVRDGSVLLVRRRVAEGGLSWQFPAGKVEPGESAREAAVREAREEAGAMSANGQVLGDRMHPVTRRRVIYVACDLISGTARVVDEDEIAEVAWCGSVISAAMCLRACAALLCRCLDVRTAAFRGRCAAKPGISLWPACSPADEYLPGAGFQAPGEQLGMAGFAGELRGGAQVRARGVLQAEVSQAGRGKQREPAAHDQQAAVLGESLTSVEQRGHITEVRADPLQERGRCRA